MQQSLDEVQLHPLMHWFSNFFAMKPYYIIGNITEPLFKIILITIKERFFYFFWEIDLGIYSQDWQLCLEFMREFFTNGALWNP